MRKGIYLALLTAVISGFSIFSNKIFVSTTDPLAFTTIRNLLVGVILTLVLLKSRSLKELGVLKKADWVKLFLIGGLGGGVAFALFFTGLAQIGAIQGNLIHKTLFIWVALLALPFLGERLSRLQIIGYICIFLATFVIAGPANFTLNQGSFLVLTATILWALENVIAKVALRNIDSRIVAWARMMIGVMILAIITIFSGKGNLLLSPKTLALLPLLISSSLLTGYVLSWYAALAKLPVTMASVILVLAPITTTILSGIFITPAVISQSQLISFLVMIVGVCLILGIRRISLISRISK